MSISMDSGISDPVAQLKERFLEKTCDACVMPSGVVEAFRLSADPDCPVEQLAKAIEQDVNLAVEVLKIANSPLFSLNEPVASLKQAAVRLGMRRCRNLIVSTCVSHMMKELPLEMEWAREVLNKHSRLTAVVCTLLNRKFSLGFAGEEYAAGLLHDFGRLALAATLFDEFPEFDDLSFNECDGLLRHEENILGTNHCEFGAWVVESNSFPTELVEVVRWHHHKIGRASIKNQPLVSLVRAGDHLANFIQTEQPLENYDVTLNAGFQELAELSRNDMLIDEFAEDLDRFVEGICQTESSLEGGSQ